MLRSNDIESKQSVLITITLILASGTSLAAPKITGSPKIVTPALLEWPQDFTQTDLYLTEPNANRLNDLHGVIKNCDIVLSTAGNYHMGLRELWQVYLKECVNDLNINTWFYTNSPPVSPKQIANRVVQFGNLEARCVPQVAVGPGKLIKKLQATGVMEGKPAAVVKNNGNVIFVRKGNPTYDSAYINDNIHLLINVSVFQYCKNVRY